MVGEKSLLKGLIERIVKCKQVGLVSCLNGLFVYLTTSQGYKQLNDSTNTESYESVPLII